MKNRGKALKQWCTLSPSCLADQVDSGCFHRKEEVQLFELLLLVVLQQAADQLQLNNVVPPWWMRSTVRLGISWVTWCTIPSGILSQYRAC